jgi:hypothetical protein
VMSFCCKWFHLHFGLPQLVFQLPTPFKLYSSSISTQEQFLWSVALILWTSWSAYWKKESQLMLANLIILFQLHKRVSSSGVFLSDTISFTTIEKVSAKLQAMERT